MQEDHSGAGAQVVVVRELIFSMTEAEAVGATVAGVLRSPQPRLRAGAAGITARELAEG